MTFATVPWFDVFAMVWFLVWAIGYTEFARRQARRHEPSLVVAMHDYRVRWFGHMLTRENRIGDIAAINGLQGVSTFFASTSILILGGLIAMLGTTEHVIDVIAEIPYTRHSSVLVFQLKIVLLIGLFVFAFFKFTWSVRQFNFCTVLVCASPPPTRTPEDHPEEIALMARIASYAADNFNQGLRAYYLALAALTWFLHPWLLVAAAVAVVMVLYRREFHSPTLYALIGQSASRGGAGG